MPPSWGLAHQIHCRLDEKGRAIWIFGKLRNIFGYRFTHGYESITAF